MKLAVIANQCQDRDGLADFLYRPLSTLCEAVRFKTGEETEGFDHYLYIDDGPSYYQEPKFHPASYFALDFVVPNVWFTNPPEHYLDRLKNFDHNYVFVSDTQDYCKEHGVSTRFMGFAADPEYHHPYPEEQIYDWSAVWHNWGERAEALDALAKRFPNGHVGWHGTGANWIYTNMNLSRSICQSKCTLNWLRANMVNMRVFESMAAGVPLITTRHPDMKRLGFIEDNHYVGYTGVEELISKVEWLLNNPVHAKNMAKRARRYVLKHHTYMHRAEQIIKDLHRDGLD